MAAKPSDQVMLHVSVDFGDSSSPQSTAVSSDSPGTATSLCFSVAAGDSPRESLADMVPKIEELDEDGIDRDETKPLPSPPEEELDVALDQMGEKKKRGRPRKYPKDVGPPKSASKGRSKTGCFTCRRRKKKCDETKPTCKHCEKNNLQCEGYPHKQVWRSGKQRASISRRLSLEEPVPLPALYEGMQRDDLDLKFFHNASKVLEIYPAGRTPWADILLPMATKHAGLMHSLLCLSGTHLISIEPNEQSYSVRRSHHYGEALRLLKENDGLTTFIHGDTSASVDDAAIAQCVVMHLASVADSRPGETYIVFSSTARDLYKARKASSPEFKKFLGDFVQYHDACSSITRSSHQPLSVEDFEDFQLPEYMLPQAACSVLGVMDGLFTCISDIKRLRDRMRQRWTAGLGVDPEVWAQATKIDADLGAWVCKLENNSGPRRVASMLYQTVTWLYLYRTMHQQTDQLKRGLETGLRYYRMLSEEGSTLSVLLMPLFLLGCSAFWQEHRTDVLEEFERLQAYSSLGNIQNAKTVVEEVWAYMDADDPQCWDWEAIMQRHGWEFLIT